MRTAWTSRRSRLEIIEPTATSIARGNEAVERLIARLAPLFPPGDAMSPEQFAVAFYQALGFDAPRSSWMSDTQPAATTAHEPAPWDTEVPLDRLATAPFRQVPLLDWQQVMFATFWDKGLI
jgi:hypothetical protein